MKSENIKQKNISSNTPGKRKKRNRKYCQNHRKAQMSRNSSLPYASEAAKNRLKTRILIFTKFLMVNYLIFSSPAVEINGNS